MIMSPCEGVCRLDAHTLICSGCFRHIEEIEAWPMLTDAQREEITTRCLHLVFENYPERK